MSAEHRPWSRAVDRLLEVCRGEGATVAAMPAAMPGGDAPHHFYAGVVRPPTVSFLEALLLVLGGDLPAGGRRYDEIVVINADAKWNEEDRDKPPEEAVMLRGEGGAVAMGTAWSTWWFRRPTKPAESQNESGSDRGGRRPSPRGGRRRDWGGVGKKARKEDPSSREFPLKITCTDREIHFPKRHKELRKILEQLQDRRHRTLLLLELAVLDFPHLESATPGEYAKISAEGIDWMAWLPAWINSRSERQSRLDVVLYGRNRRRVEAFLGEGLPRRPPQYTGAWPVSVYNGRNLVVVDYPCGAYPWGSELFGKGEGLQFGRYDGTANDSPEGRQAYPNRTLRALLRGQSPSGRTVRVRITNARPLAPERPELGAGISREFWSQVDVPAVRKYVLDRYFGAESNEPLLGLFNTITELQETAAAITSSVEFHEAVKDRWLKASNLMLWGIGGMGKSYLGKLLGEALFGHEPHVVKGQEAGGGSHTDPILAFRSSVFGPPAGYVGADRLTAAGSHIVSTQGFTVLVIDEVQAIAQDFTEGFRALFGMLEDREYQPQNPALTQNRKISLWNTVFVLTANLPSFPPPGVPGDSVQAIRRRVSDYEFRELEPEQVQGFVQWHLPKAIESELGGASIVTCGDISEEIGRIEMEFTTLDQVRKSLQDEVLRIKDELARDGINASNCPLLLDITDYVRRALA